MIKVTSIRAILALIKIIQKYLNILKIMQTIIKLIMN